MNIITIDPSLSCTALIINDKKFIYTTNAVAKTKKDKLKQWFDLCEDLIEYRFHDNINCDDHASSELQKFKLFSSITNNIILDIKASCDVTLPTHIMIEGYSHSSNAGPLIDLVTFGSILRYKLLMIFDSITIAPPTTVKLEAAKLTYAPIEKGVRVKTYEWRNSEGVAGGKFTKNEMYKVLIENTSMNCKWVTFLRENQIDIQNLKNIPKPIEDMNDAKIMYEIMLKRTK